MKKNKEKLWTKDYIFIILMSTFQASQMQLVNPIMSKYSKSIGIDINTVGIIVGIFAIAALIIRPVSGPLSDRYNNKLVASISALMMGVTTLGYIVAGDSIVLIFIFRFLHGIAFGICGTTLMRMASYLVAKSRLGEGMGCFGLGQVVAFALAPSIGIYLSETFGYNVAFITSAFVVVGVGIMAFFLKLPKEMHYDPTKVVEKKKFGLSSIVAKEALLFAVVACCMSFAMGMDSSYIVIYGESIGLSNVGIYFTVGAVTMFVARISTSKLMDKKGVAFVVVPSLLSITTAMIILAIGGYTVTNIGISATFMVFMVASVFKSLGQGCCQPALQAACLQAVPMERRGVASSTYFMGCDIGMGLGPMLGGVIAGMSNYNSMFIFAAVMVVIGLITFFIGKRSLAKSY